MGINAGQFELRKENVERIIQDLVQQEYVMKQVVRVISSSAVKETYWREASAELTAQATAAIRDVPRLAAFPEMTPSMSRITAYTEKYGATYTIPWEDLVTDEIDVLARALVKVANAVANAVDTRIWNVLTESQSASNINSVSISAGSEWDAAVEANRNPIQNILNAIREIAKTKINPYSQESFIALSPTDFANLMGNSKVLNNPTWTGGSDIMGNGRVGKLLGLTVIVSPVVTDDYAAVFIGKMCGVWREVAALTTVTNDIAGVSRTITSWEYGVVQLSQPKAVCLISNTQA